MIARLPSLAVLVVLLSLTAAQAAPPTVNAFFPAGGQRGTTVAVVADGVFPHWPVEFWVEGKGIDVKPSKDKGKFVVTIAPDALPGTYGIRLYDGEGASVARPFIVGTIPEIMEKEPNDDPGKPQILQQTSVTVNGRLDKSGDVDTFALALKKGQTLVASLDANRTLRSPMDGHLQVVSPDGFVLEHNDDFHGLDPQIIFPVPRDGTFLVRTFAFPAKPDATINFAGGSKFIYRLTLTTGAFFDYAYPLAVSRSAPGDVDMVGWNIPPALRKLSVQASADADSTTLSHPESASVVQVRMEAHPATVKAPGSSRKNPQKIEVPTTVSGRIDRPGDVDCYRFAGKKGQKLVFRVESQTLGFPLDPVLRLTDVSGKEVLAKAQAKALGKDPVLDFTVPKDGLFNLEVHDLHGTGSQRHVYRLQAVPAKSDFTLKLATDRFVVLAGKPLDIPIAIERVYGFNKDIEVSVEGLPKGVTMATVPQNNAAAKTVTLRLIADKTAFSGPVRIMGKAKRGDGGTRIGHASVADLDSATEHLWLTVPK